MWNTSVSIPCAIDMIERDADGFSTVTKTFLDHIPASRLSATRADETLANQLGYTADIVFEIMAGALPEDAGWLRDESDNRVYDIKRIYRGATSNTVLLTCQGRSHGKI